MEAVNILLRNQLGIALPPLTADQLCVKFSVNGLKPYIEELRSIALKHVFHGKLPSSGQVLLVACFSLICQAVGHRFDAKTLLHTAFCTQAEYRQMRLAIEGHDTCKSCLEKVKEARKQIKSQLHVNHSKRSLDSENQTDDTQERQTMNTKRAARSAVTGIHSLVRRFSLKSLNQG